MLFFSLVMALTRLMGDSILEALGNLKVLRVSALSATLGITVFALANGPVMAMVGAVLSGLGVAVVYPLAMTAAAARPGSAVENVASVALVSFSAFLLAPPIIGFIADWVGLRWALVSLAPLAAMTYMLSSEVAPVTGDRTSRTQ